MEPIAYLNGNFVNLRDAKVSILDRGFCYGDALFETLRAYSGTIFRMDQHLDRLERGAKSIFFELPKSRQEFGTILYQTLEKNQITDGVLRLTVTRGLGTMGKLWQTGMTPNLSVYAAPYKGPPVEWYEKGVPVSLIPDCAPKFGGMKEQIKTTNYLSQILARKQAVDQNSVDAVMVNEKGEVCDGTIFNIFLVKNEELSTPAVNGYVLAGVSRQVVLDVASQSGIACRERTINVEDVLQADEIFLTNTGWEVLPVTRVNGETVGNGQPGPLTRRLRQGFQKCVDAEIGK
ncbi:MAG: aminotransferase class IV [Nitrospinota bacterium]|nr:aminotransferase class IV [Nitrospinota bacterium]